MPDGDEVRVVFRKYDGSLHWHAWMHRLGQDEHGVWLGGSAETAWQRGSEPPVSMNPAHVTLIPHQGWWVASFNALPARFEVYVDVTTEPTWPSADEVTMVDLDLDVVRHRDSGAAELLDEDEFAAHQERYGYPSEVIDRTRDAARWLMATVTEREPFTSAFHRWLAMVTPGLVSQSVPRPMETDDRVSD